MNKKTQKVFYCENCKYYSSDMSNFKRHLISNIHIENQEKFKKLTETKRITIYHCLECDKIYKSQNSLQHHNKMHEKKNRENLIKKLNEDNNELQKKLRNDSEILIKQLKEDNEKLQKKLKENSEITQNKLNENTRNTIKLIKNANKKKFIPHSLKIKVWNRWIGKDVGSTTCPCCEVNEITQMNFNCGHIQAESKGGDQSVDNLKPVCQSCNSSMGTQNMDDFKNKYLTSNEDSNKKVT